MKSIESAEDISFLAFGFMASKALFAALHVDVFGALADGSKSVTALAGDCDVPEHRMETLVTALVAVGLLVKDGGNVANSEASQSYLVRESTQYFGDYLRFQIDRQMYPFMQNLDNVLIGKTDGIEFETYADWMADQGHAELFSRSQHSGSLGPGAVLAKRLNLGDEPIRLLDVGGGSGAFSIMFAKRYPNLTASVMDFPNVIKVGEAFVDEAGLSDRVKFVAGDGTNANWPVDQDIVLMSYLFSGVPGEAIPKLCSDAFRVTRPGGRIVVHDFMVEDDHSGPPLAALWQLQHMVYTPDGFGMTPGFIRDEMAKAGFIDIEEYDLIPGMTRVLEGTKA